MLKMASESTLENTKTLGGGDRWSISPDPYRSVCLHCSPPQPRKQDFRD